MIFSENISVITGASQGIGEAIAHELSKEGAEVVLVDIQEDKLHHVVKTIKGQGGKAWAYPADVSDAGQVKALTDTIIKKYSRIDHLVNNAGITRDGLLMRMKEKDWDAVMTVNLKGAFNLCQAIIRPMLSRRYGRIVNISSVVGIMGNAGQANYSASKAGLLGLTKSLAREVAARGITVNAIAPGYIATDMTKILQNSVKEKFIDIIPMKRFGTPEEIALSVKFLLSDDAAYITGQVLSVNGGMYM